MVLDADVVVVGEGVAGCLAAAAARGQGARVILVAAGTGATGLSSTTVDVADDLDFDASAGCERLLYRGAPYLDSVARLAEGDPDHPYARVGSAGCSRIPAALAALQELAIDIELTGSSVVGHNLVLATSLGTVKRTALAPSSVADGDLGLHAGARVGVAHMARLAGFDGRAIAEVLRFMSSNAPPGLQFTVDQVDVPFWQRARDAQRSLQQLARLLDDPIAVSAMARGLEGFLLEHGGLDLLLVPAAIGAEHARLSRFRLQALAGMRVAEVCHAGRSPLGGRFTRALRTGIARAGVTRCQGRVRGVTPEEDGFTLRYETGSGDGDRVHARSLVLATGHLVGGGIAFDRSPRESVMGLPLFLGSESAERPTGRAWMGASYAASHPLLQVGVAIDGSLRPLLTPRGRPVHERLFACGALVGGNDPSRTKAGLGLCALTGFLAGECAAAA